MSEVCHKIPRKNKLINSFSSSNFRFTSNYENNFHLLPFHRHPYVSVKKCFNKFFVYLYNKACMKVGVDEKNIFIVGKKMHKHIELMKNKKPAGKIMKLRII